MSTWKEACDWVPKVAEGSRILVVGASGGIGRALTTVLAESEGVVIGAHHGTTALPAELAALPGVWPIQATLSNDGDCRRLVDAFLKEAGRMDAIVVLCGGLLSQTHWLDLHESQWNADLTLNLSLPFFLARAGFDAMREGGGRIVLTGTESALHGGGAESFAYGISKMGTECMVQGMAREGAKHGVLVNGVRLGFIDSGFHARWKGMAPEDIARRADMVPLRRPGSVWEVAALVAYLLSDWGAYITGQMLPLTGGDWL
ncbi:MAG: SDR family oxidoreductase [Pseudomonadota bacterium]